MNDALVQSLINTLDKRVEARNPVEFWLRDDDAIEPSEPLERLLALTSTHAIPLTLAVIPALSGEALARRLATVDQVSVAVHGWSHANHAPPNEKKQELGLHRPVDTTLAELSRGYAHLESLHGSRFVPLLVPPWNRIAPAIVESLADLGYRGLSTFGTSDSASISVLNTHVDLIDWKGTRGGRDHDTLLAELIKQLQVTTGPVGLLTHHLVHDDRAWRFLEDFFTITADQSGCTWVAMQDYISVS